MTSEPIPLNPERQALVERAARWRADRPQTIAPITELIAKFELSVFEAHAAARRADEMRICRSAFA